MSTLTTSRGPAEYPDGGLPVYSNQDAAYQFSVTNVDLTGASAKLQFKDATTGALLLELASPTKIVIVVTSTTVGSITLLISAADSLVLSHNVKWDLFVTDAAGKRKAFVKGDVCYSTSITTF